MSCVWPQSEILTLWWWSTAVTYGQLLVVLQISGVIPKVYGMHIRRFNGTISRLRQTYFVNNMTIKHQLWTICSPSMQWKGFGNCLHTTEKLPTYVLKEFPAIAPICMPLCACACLPPSFLCVLVAGRGASSCQKQIRATSWVIKRPCGKLQPTTKEHMWTVSWE